jgi:hypothetical protein
MGKKQKLLFEDFNKIYNKWVSGIAKRESSSNVITVDDIVNQYRNNSEYEAPKELPFPLDKSLPLLADIFTKISAYRGILEQASGNPVIKENKESLKQLQKVWKKMQTMQDILFSVTVNLNKIVAKEETESNYSENEDSDNP